MLSLAPWYFAAETDNCAAATLNGTQVVAAASNSIGTAVTMLTSLSHDVHYLMLQFGTAASPSGTNPCALIDLLTDPAGGTSWSVMIACLQAGPGWNPFAPIAYPQSYAFPLWIPAGSSVGLRARTTHTAARNYRCVIHAFGEPSNPAMWWCGTAVEPLGVTTVSSRGTTVTPATGASGTLGAWTSIGMSTYRYGAVQPGWGGVNGTAYKQQEMRLQIGYGSNQLAGSSQWELGTQTAECGRFERAYPIWCDVPSGTTWQARMAADIVSPDAQQIAIYGVY